MPLMELPHASGCFVCGRANTRGLRLDLRVHRENGMVYAAYTPAEQHEGFVGVVHGGLLAAVLDEAMTWAATWAGRRFCVCGEMTVRFRRPVAPGTPLLIAASVETKRNKLIETAASVTDASGHTVVSAEGKYVPVPPEKHAEFLAAMLDEPMTHEALAVLRGAAEMTR